MGVGAHRFELAWPAVADPWSNRPGVDGDSGPVSTLAKNLLQIRPAEAPYLLRFSRAFEVWPKTIVYGRIRKAKKHMPPRHILSPQSRAARFDPPTDAASIVRHYTFSPKDLALIRQRRRVANRLGFAVNLAYLRFPGRVPGVDEAPPADMLAFIAAQVGCEAAEFAGYARREETRWEHLGELQAYLAARPFRHDDKRAVGHRRLAIIRRRSPGPWDRTPARARAMEEQSS